MGTKAICCNVIHKANDLDMQSPRCDDESLVLDPCVQPRIMAKRRRSRRRTITTLPDHVKDQLVHAFSQVDVTGEGKVHRLKLVEIVKEAYHPTEAEVKNIEEYLIRSDKPLFNAEITFESFVMIFDAVVQPMLAKSPGCSIGWALLREIFDTTVTQIARHGPPPLLTSSPVAERITDLSITELHCQELKSLFEAMVDASTERQTTLLRELVRQAFVLTPQKLSQLAAFFNTSRDELVELGQFIHGMTLLYGDMQLLIPNAPAPASMRQPAAPQLPLIGGEPKLELENPVETQSSPSSRGSPRQPSLGILQLSVSPRLVPQSVPPELWMSPPPSALTPL